MIMELSQENETRTPGLERRREGNNNGTTVNSLSQTLDQLQRQPSLGQARSPHPDRVTVSSSTIAPISIGSNSKMGSVRYRECLKNHAASVGGNVFDGCGEFMPSGEEGTLEALKCAACDCHRNFHRKEVNGETQFSGNCSRRTIILNPLQLPPPLPSPTMLHHQKYSIGMHTSPSSAIVAPMNVAYGGLSGGTESSSEDLHVFQSNAHEGVQPPPPPFVLSKKRFRTKFTQEQKDKMMEFAEKVGWRFQRQDDEEVEKFCAELGVRRQVFKVWMHNNKSNAKKQQPESQCNAGD
ncbi:zinc-finger homeodomain protein 5 [Pistacia vera]|uniref:zinc-finger homeodomain protein 5 n=1 Tax=Pistacia vera TaxID=55513 RepID=UPI001262DA39|nr:zinc-finger homeodomain protein 5 [Pistacia vera]